MDAKMKEIYMQLLGEGSPLEKLVDDPTVFKGILNINGYGQVIVFDFNPGVPRDSPPEVLARYAIQAFQEQGSIETLYHGVKAIMAEYTHKPYVVYLQ